MTGIDPLVLRDPQQVPEMAPILDALRRGTSRARLRTLDIACRKNHRLAEVFGTGERAVLLGYGRVQYAEEVREGRGAAPLAELRRPTLEETIAVRVQCKCQTVPLWVNRIDQALSEGVRRVVW